MSAQEDYPLVSYENEFDTIYKAVRKAVIKTHETNPAARNLRHKALLIIADSTEEQPYTFDILFGELERRYRIKVDDPISLYGMIGTLQRGLPKYVGRVKKSFAADTKTRYFFRIKESQKKK